MTSVDKVRRACLWQTASNRAKVCWSSLLGERQGGLETVAVHIDVGPRTLCGHTITTDWTRGTTFSAQFRVTCLTCRRMLGYKLEDLK